MKALAWLGVLAAACAQAYSVAEVRTGEPSKSRLVAVVRAPKGLGGGRLAAWYVLCKSMLSRNDRYTSGDISTYGSQTGEPVQVNFNDELLMISMASLPDGLPVLANLVEAMLFRPKVNADLIKEAERMMNTKRESDLGAFLLGNNGDWGRVTSTDVRDVWMDCVRSENISFGVSQGDQPGFHASIVEKVMGRRTGTALGLMAGLDVQISFEGPGFGWVGGVGWTPFAPDKSASKTLVAMSGLGVGFDSAAYRSVREALALTYLQQSFIRAGRDGLRPSLVFGGSAPFDWAKGRDAMVKAIKNWTIEDLKRAQAVTEASLKGGYPLSPFEIAPGLQYQNTPEDRVRWAAYAGLVGGASSPDDLSAGINAVTLEEFTSEANRLLDSALPIGRW